MKKTNLLKNFLFQQEALISADEYRQLSEEVDRLIQKFMLELKAMPPGVARAQKVHEFIDGQNQSFSHIATSCAKGCGYCCHLEVEITEDDAERLVNAVVDLNISLDLELLEIQSQRERQDESWKRGCIKENRCVMLDENNSCRVYASRPVNCRKHAVVSPVSECSTLGASPVSRIIPMNEIFMSAYISLPNLQFGSLSKLLLRALQKRKDMNQIHNLDFIEPLSASLKVVKEPEVNT
ncbi:MAG: YkgJ family cysteine cluster protein [Pseudobdellovibrionaceae bacterium]